MPRGTLSKWKRAYQNEKVGRWAGLIHQPDEASFLPRSRLVAEMVFVNFPVECGEADIQKTGGFRLITLGVIENPLYMQLLHAGQVKCRERAGGSGTGIPELGGQIACRQLLAVRDDGSPFYDILQLPDITLPLMLLEMSEEVLVHTGNAFGSFGSK